MSEKTAEPDPLLSSNTSSQIPVATIYISNVSEDVWPFITQMSDPQVKQREIEENSLFSDRDLLAFGGKDHTRIILPHQVEPSFWQYYLKTFGNKNTEVWVPQKHTGEICLDILADQNLLEQIKAFASTAKKLHILSYSTSSQFLLLIKALRDMGVAVVTPEAPEEQDAWTVNFYGSKAGIRQLAQQSLAKEPDFKMSPGMIVSDSLDAAKIAAKMYIKNGGVVVKTNKGHAGAGVYIWREGDLPTSYTECQEEIFKHLKKDKYWDEFSIVIEELVNINPTLGGGNPNVEFKILKNGEVKFLYSGGMRVSKEGIFGGMEVNRDVLPEKITTQMVDTGYYIAEQYAAQGYRGYFDVDFVGARNGQIYIAESNVRRTGATHVYHVAKELIGDNFLYETYALSTNFYKLPDASIKIFTDLANRLEPILFNKKTQEGVVIASANLLAIQQMGYVILGKDKKRALAIEAEMERRLGKK